MTSDKIALKPFLTAISGWCESLTADQLTGVILGLAKSVPTTRRQAFLDSVRALLPESTDALDMEPDPDEIERLLERIDALKEEITERIDLIESGEYFDDLDSWDDEYDDDPDYVTDEQVDELASLFDSADDLFLDDRMADALKAYQALFDLAPVVKEHGYIGSKIDLREARTRLCRCVYESAPEAQRLKLFGEAMQTAETDSGSFRAELRIDDLPKLQDVIDAKPEEMAGLDRFLPEWRDSLEERWRNPRTANLFLEAVYRLSGIAAVADTARKWGNEQPLGYLFWLETLTSDGETPAIQEVAAEGLKTVRNGMQRALIAQFLIQGATAAGNPGRVLMGMRERFLSNPGDTFLLEWIGEAAAQGAREKELARAVDHFRSKRHLEHGEKALRIKCLLMAGNLDEAFNLGADERKVGWSFGSNNGILFSAVLSTLSECNSEATTIRALLEQYGDRNSNFSPIVESKEEPRRSFSAEILTGLQLNTPKPAWRERYLKWAVEIGEGRVDHIVSNKHRGAYNRAAQVLAALAETHLAMGRKTEALSTLRRFYKEKYKRFSAFRREVTQAADRSQLLKGLSF